MVATASLVLTLVSLEGIGPVAKLTGVNFWSIAAAFALAEILPVHLEHRREAISLTLSIVPFVIGLSGLSPITLIAARLTGSALTLALHRRQQLLKLSVNLTSFWAQGVISVLVFHQLGSYSRGSAMWTGLLLAVLAGDTAQTLVLTAAISLYQGSWERGLLGSAAVGTVAAAVETCLGIVAVSLLTSQPAALLPLSVVTGLVLLSYRTHRSLRDRHRELSQLYDFASVIGDALPDGKAVASLLTQARLLMHADQAWLYLPDQTGRLMRVADTSEGTRAAADDGLGSALQAAVPAHGGPCLVRASDERIRHLRSAAAVREFLVAPLVGRDGLIGILVVVDRSGQVRQFATNDMRLFGTIANHARVSLENDQLVDRLREKAAESEHQSLHDALTGLPNRILFSRLVTETIQAGSSAAVLLLDLDRFKEVNDTLGHHNGDQLLELVGTRLRTALRRGDMIARLGGDEFAILLPGADTEQSALQVGRGVVEILQQPFQLGDMSIDVGASIGIAFAPRDGTDPSTLVRRADVAMYTAKTDQTGVEIYRSERDGYSPQRLTLVSDLKRAILQHDLDVHYQPQICLTTGQLKGVEALVRWNHPTRGVVPPDEFIDVAEHTGLIRPLTQYVLETALASSHHWRQFQSDARVSVNISARSLLEPTLVDDVAELLNRYQTPASGLCLEVTESSIMGDPRRTATNLNALRSLGVTIAIDDFGMGQSSLAYIKRLPVGEIKIDKSFVLSMLSDRSDEAIVETVVNLGRNLGIPVTAEGIEDELTRRRLHTMGCPVGQGFHFARPMPEAPLVAWLAERASDTLAVCAV